MFLEGFVMSNKFVVKIMIALATVFAITLISIAIIFIVFSRNKCGEEFKKLWYYDDFKISFISDDQRFPYIANSYSGKIESIKDVINVTVSVDENTFTIGIDGDIYYDSKGMPCSDFYTIASGNSYYNGFNYIVWIDNVQDQEFEYLMSQALVFTRIE